MKNRVLVDICGREFALITDETESYMKALAAEVNKMINDSTYKNLRTSRNDAALLICLDLCDRKNKLSAANDNMRAQVTAYAEEIDDLKKQLELSEQKLAMKNHKANSEGGEYGSEPKDEGENEIQEQPEDLEGDLQDEYADADTDNPDDLEQRDYTAETENKSENKTEIKFKSAQDKPKPVLSPSLPPSYGSYLFGSGRNRRNADSVNINDGNDADDEDNRRREKDFESLKERFNKLQKDMSKS